MAYDGDRWDKELKSAVAMIQCAYPDGIPDEDYFPLIKILVRGMDSWYVGRLLYAFFGIEAERAFDDAMDVLLGRKPGGDRVSIVQDKLEACGYEKWLVEWEVPPWMRSTIRMISCAYPNGVPEVDYRPLLYVIRSADFSFRGVADVMKIARIAEWPRAYNDVSAIEGDFEPNSADVVRVRERLLPCGYDAWHEESALPE